MTTDLNNCLLLGHLKLIKCQITNKKNGPDEMKRYPEIREGTVHIYGCGTTSLIE